MKRHEDVTIINIMADGSICEDLRTYLGPEHPLPETTQRLLLEAMRRGAQVRKERQMARQNQ